MEGRNPVPNMEAPHVKKSFLYMQRNQMWRNSLEEFLLVDTYCIYVVLFNLIEVQRYSLQVLNIALFYLLVIYSKYLK